MGNLGEIIFAGSIQLQTAVEFLCYFLIAADFFFMQRSTGKYFIIFFRKIYYLVSMILSQVWFSC